MRDIIELTILVMLLVLSVPFAVFISPMLGFLLQCLCIARMGFFLARDWI